MSNEKRLLNASESISARLDRRRQEIEVKLPGITDLALICKEVFGYCQVERDVKGIVVSPVQPRDLPKWAQRRKDGQKD